MGDIKKKELIDEFLELLKEYSKENNSSNITRDWWRSKSQFTENDFTRLFGSFTNFKKEALGHSSLKKREFTNVVAKGKSGKSVYFVTSVIEGAKFSNEFYNAIDTFCDKNNAKKVFLWTRGTRRDSMFTMAQFDLLGKNLYTEFTFNDKLKAKDFMLYPSQMLPLTGLCRFGSRDSSLIIASPKQHMMSVPRPKTLQPHSLWSTGTMSIPDYADTRSGSFAKQDNTLGGLIVEVQDSKRFYIRPVQFKDNCFIDLGNVYHSNGKVSKTIAEAIVWGDLHLTDEDSDAVKASISQTKELNAKRVFLHDVCSWNSVNRHEQNKYIINAYTHLRTLEDDYSYTAKELSNIIRDTNSRKGGSTDFYIVKSNHDLWVKKWVEQGEFVKDRVNSISGAKAFLNFCYGNDPIELEVKEKLDKQAKKFVHFLKQDESFKVAGYELGQHGENGANGSKGSIKSFGRIHDKIVVGHSHSPNIYYSAIQVGTNSKLNMPYAVGDSSWMHANCIIYPNGTFQLVTFLDSKWKL